MIINESDKYKKQKYTIVNTIEKTNIEADSFIRKEYIKNGRTISSSYLLSIAMLLYDRRLLSVNKDESNIVIDIIYNKSDYNGINKNKDIDFMKNNDTFIFKKDTLKIALNSSSNIEAIFKGFNDNENILTNIEATFKGFNDNENILTNIKKFKNIFDRTKTSDNSEEEKLRRIKVWLNWYIGIKHQNIVLLNPKKIQIFNGAIEIKLFKNIVKLDINQYIIKVNKNKNLIIANEEYSKKFREYLELFME